MELYLQYSSDLLTLLFFFILAANNKTNKNGRQNVFYCCVSKSESVYYCGDQIGPSGCDKIMHRLALSLHAKNHAVLSTDLTHSNSLNLLLFIFIFNFFIKLLLMYGHAGERNYNFSNMVKIYEYYISFRPVSNIKLAL